MNAAAPDLAKRAAALRLAFDEAFAVPLRTRTTVQHDLLAIRVGTEPYALRLAEIRGLFADRKITRIPGVAATLLGIAGFRGTLMPVYSLRTLLGHSGTQAPRWLVIAADAPVALAFDGFDGHLRAASDAILPQQQKKTRDFAPDFIRAGDLVRPIVHLPSVVDALGPAQPGRGTANQE